MKRVFIVSFMACLALVGCKKQMDDNIDLANDETSISLNSTIDGIAPVAQSASSSRAATGILPSASKLAWVNQDKFGFFLSLSSDALKLVGNTHGKFTYDNIPYLYSTATTPDASFAPTSTIYYPYRTTNVDLWGVYPFDGSITTKDVAKYAWTVTTNQSTDANVLASDLLVAHVKNVTPNGILANASKTVDMPFSHKMTRLMVTLTIPTEIDGKTLSTTKPIETIEVRGVKTNGTYNFNLDQISPSGDKQVVSPRFCGNIETPDVQHFYEALMIPQTIAAGELFLRVVVNFQAPNASEPGLYLLDLGAPLVLGMGTQQNLDIVFDSQMRLRLNGSQVAKWNNSPIFNETIYADQSTVRINNVDWATGNLVFDNQFGCKIGTPDDKGLFFQFGSLVGWDEGATLAAKVYPSGITPAWNSNYFNAATPVTGELFNVIAQDNAPATLGQGDACRYYLGQGWRLPTSSELASISGKTGSTAIAWDAGVTGKYIATKGAWFGPLFANKNTLTSLYTPAAGQRAAAAGGALSEANSGGYYSSASITAAATAARLKFDASGATPALALDRKIGASVRCVKAFTLFTYDPAIIAKAASSTTKLMFDVSSDASWVITGAPAWLTLSAASGDKLASTPAQSVTLTATSINATSAIRSAQLTITITDKARSITATKTMTVSQNF